MNSVILDTLFLQLSENSVRGAAGVTAVTIVCGEEQDVISVSTMGTLASPPLPAHALLTRVH